MDGGRIFSYSLLMATHLICGCMTGGGAQGGGEGELVSYQAQALDLQANPFDPDPPLTDIPSCWWVDDLADCDVKPDCVPTPPVSPTRPPNLTVRTAANVRMATITLAVSATRPGPASTSAADKIKRHDPCPSPTGVPTCSTCSRSYADPWRASLELRLASRVLITNGLNNSSFAVKNYPLLNVQVLGEEGLIPTIEVDLSQGTTMMQSGSVNYSQDLYMFFTSDFDTGPYPVGNWVFCPKNGNPCVQLTD